MTKEEAMNYKVGRFFSLWDFLHDSYADYRPSLLKRQLEIPDAYIQNARDLCENILDPLHLNVGQIVITNGYMCPELASIHREEPTSQHRICEAVDIIIPNMRITFKYIADHLLFDMLIDEYNLSCIHVSYSKENNRHEILRHTRQGYAKITSSMI